jgi:deoxyribodipyrimidine photo-lyase
VAAPALVWFRDDLRLSDNPALTAALETGAPILCLFVLDEVSEGLRPLGGASRWWLHGSLASLDKALRALGSELYLLRGAAADLIERLVVETGASAVFWNRRYSAAEIAIDAAIKKRLTDKRIAARSFNGRLLHEPWEIKNRSGRPFQVFTPYWRAARLMPVPVPLPAPKQIQAGRWPDLLQKRQIGLSNLRLEPSTPDWAGGLKSTWLRGEAAAQAALLHFLDTALAGYARNRNFPAIAGTSRLSPHLRFGEISPRQVWHAVQARLAQGPELAQDAEKYLNEVIWRDFCHQILHDHPHLPSSPHSSRFDQFPWENDPRALEAWQKGRTGYPIVDAGMRQLWQTGWMHNRARMIAASFLIKHLLTDWRHGEAWFWDTLVDADAANNAFGWQWTAGSGPDSAPFHRIFNPLAQGEKFDPDGDYVRAYVPELAALPSSLIHRPWEAPSGLLHSAGIALGQTYPLPVVPHGPARERALEAFRSLRGPQADISA